MFSTPRKEDFLASLIVFIVALPLSLGISMASGMSAESGLITAIIGGMVCGLLSGAPMVVSGPAAGLAAFVFQLVQEHGIKGLAIITVVAGLIQILMGAFRMGKLFTYVPKAVLEGMLSVIGFIIASLQLHVLMGSPLPKSPIQAFTNMPETLRNIYIPILICGLVALIIQIYWGKVFKKLSWIPGALPAVIIVTALSLIWEMPRVQFGNFISGIIESMDSLSFSSIFQSGFWGLLLAALGLAVVASAETLLTAIAVDGLASKNDSKHIKSNLNQELLAQGVSNSLSGWLGGLPMTGVIVRSAVNVNAGAKTKWSTILHGLWIGLFVIFLPGVLQLIPLTALAAVLVITGVRLLNVKEFIHVIRKSRRQGFVWATTFCAIFLTDLLTGLIIGLVVAFIGEALISRVFIKNHA